MGSGLLRALLPSIAHAQLNPEHSDVSSSLCISKPANQAPASLPWALSSLARSALTASCVLSRDPLSREGFCSKRTLSPWVGTQYSLYKIEDLDLVVLFGLYQPRT